MVGANRRLPDWAAGMCGANSDSFSGLGVDKMKQKAYLTPVLIDEGDISGVPYLPMSEGLDGYWWETDKVICVPLVIAKRPGAFSEFLKVIEAKNKTVFFPCIVSARLDAILRARGYEDAFVLDKEMNDVVDGLARIVSHD